MPRLVDELGWFAPIAAVFVGALLMIVLVPRTLITVAWGALFGAVGGAGYILAGALIAALLGFGVGRWLGRDFVAERVRGRLARLDGWFGRQSVLGVITVRLLPIGGFGLVSYGYGTTGARLWPYLAGQRAGHGAVGLRLRGRRRGGQLAGRHQLARGRSRHLRTVRQRGDRVALAPRGPRGQSRGRHGRRSGQRDVIVVISAVLTTIS